MTLLEDAAAISEQAVEACHQALFAKLSNTEIRNYRLFLATCSVGTINA
jgi:hypothetical protein